MICNVYNNQLQKQVATKLVKPYYDELLLNNGTTIRRGYAIDLVEEIFKHIKETNKIELQHEFYVVSGDKVGTRITGSKKWDGIIGDVMEHVSRYTSFYMCRL